MSFRTGSIIMIALVTAFVLYQLSGDERLQNTASGIRQAVDHVRTQDVLADTIAGVPRILRGPARVVDGATLEFLEPTVTVHLADIYVCDRAQPAYFQATPWPCGAVATAWLISQTLGQTVECQILDRLHNGETIGRCGVNGADLAAEAIVNGHAVVSDNAAGVPVNLYRVLEDNARGAGTGLWSSTFTPPAEWRKDRARDRSSDVRHVPGQTEEPDEEAEMKSPFDP